MRIEKWQIKYLGNKKCYLNYRFFNIFKLKYSDRLYYLFLYSLYILIDNWLMTVTVA